MLVALAILASLSALAPTVIRQRLAPLDSATAYLFSEFYIYFGRTARQAFATAAEGSNFRASDLAGTYPLAEGSDKTATVAFESCASPNSFGRLNSLPPTEAEALAAAITRQTPAQVILTGNGQTGGVILNEIYARRIPEQNLRLVRYRLNGPPGTTPQVALIIGTQEQCQ